MHADVTVSFVEMRREESFYLARERGLTRERSVVRCWRTDFSFGERALIFQKVSIDS